MSSTHADSPRTAAEPQGLFPDEASLGLLTDFYELTMAAAYFAHGLADQVATFELYIRRLPPQRNYLLAAGLEQVVHYLRHVRFTPTQIAFLRRHPAMAHVPAAWFDALAEWRFTGELWALPEGTIFFPPTPILRITAPLMTAQVLETYLITTITAQTMVASKAARVVTAAQGRGVIDFGSRRAHGPHMGLLAARAAYLAGAIGTSNTEAALRLGIPALGTQAHAWIMAWGDEVEAFRRFGTTFPTMSTLLVDTYDTLQGVRHALASGAPMQAIRLDSGDLLALSRSARAILDAAGRTDVRIIASGDLNETKIAELLAAGAPIDGFGVGTELVTSRDEPTLSTVYKLVEQHTPRGIVGRAKTAEGKISYPFAKQVYRVSDGTGRFKEDLIARVNEPAIGEPLLTLVMQDGNLAAPLPPLAQSRDHAADQLRRLPAPLRELTPAPPYPVRFSSGLQNFEAEAPPA